MERIEKICQVLKQIKKLSSSILTQALPILKRLDTKPEQLLAEFIKETGEEFIDKHDVYENFKMIVLAWISDAEIIKDEIDSFMVLKDGNVNINTDKCEFLSQVWHGDTYDKTELEGLEELLKDLGNQFKRITLENLYEETHKILYKA